MEGFLIQIGGILAASAVAYGLSLLRKKVISQIKNEEIKAILNEVAQAVEASVGAVAQTKKRHYKAKLEGSLSPSVREALRNSAEVKVMDTVGSERLDTLKKHTGMSPVGVSQMIRDKIENEVKKGKEKANAGR